MAIVHVLTNLRVSKCEGNLLILCEELLNIGEYLSSMELVIYLVMQNLRGQ